MLLSKDSIFAFVWGLFHTNMQLLFFSQICFLFFFHLYVLIFSLNIIKSVYPS